MAILTLQNVSKNFRKKKVLNNFSLEIEAGDFIGLIGPSGSGKSVLIKTMIGFLKPDKGKVITSEKIGFSMQANALYGGLTMKENLNYFAKLYKVKNRKERIEILIEKLSLQEYNRTLVKNLSGGTKKRLDIACSLLNRPSILILDEPFVGLDPFLVRKLAELLSSLNKEGITIIMSSHILNVHELCNKIYLINGGNLRQITKEQLRGFK